MATVNVSKINQQTDYNNNAERAHLEYSSIEMNKNIMSTGDMGRLIPVHLAEMIPGETTTINGQIATQFNPFVSNLFHNIYGEILWYFVPHRLTWDGWENFITGGPDGKDTSVVPTVDLVNLYSHVGAGTAEDQLHTLADYFEMPIDIGAPGSHPSAGADRSKVQPIDLPWRAYNQIYNDHIRIIDIEPNPVDLLNNDVLHGNWEHDYFTRCRVFQNRGSTPSIPISDDLQAMEHRLWTTIASSDENFNLFGANLDHTTTGNVEIDTHSSVFDPRHEKWNTLRSKGLIPKDLENYPIGKGSFDPAHTPAPLFYENHDVSKLGMNMNDFLSGLAIMKYQVRNSKTQPRYVDQLWIRWGIVNQDTRLQRSEYLGSNYFNIATDAVIQTAPPTSEDPSKPGSTPQGHITGQAWGGGEGIHTRYEAQEHGYLVALMIIRPRTVYEQGLQRRFVKRDKFDFATPELANMPDVPVYAYEFSYNAHSDNDKNDNLQIFGWQGIYEEYRTMTHSVTGRLRPSVKGNLKSMTLARYFDSAPKFNKDFVKCNPDKGRILQYMNEPTFMHFINLNIRKALPLPLQSNPVDLNLI